MQKTIILLYLITMYSSPLAQGTEKTISVFQCETANNKSIRIYKAKNMLTYSFSRSAHQPELKLQKEIEQVKISIGNISGSDISNSAAFINGAYTYKVMTRINKTAENQNPSSGVLILKNSQYITYIACTPDTVQDNLLILD